MGGDVRRGRGHRFPHQQISVFLPLIQGIRKEKLALETLTEKRSTAELPVPVPHQCYANLVCDANPSQVQTRPPRPLRDVRMGR